LDELNNQLNPMHTINKFYTLLILVFSLISTSYSQDWIDTDITDFANIKFPVASQVNHSEKGTLFTAQNEFGIYMVALAKLPDQQSSNISEAEIQMLYDGMMQGTLDAANGKIVSKKEITINTIPAKEYEYKISTPGNEFYKRFKRTVYMNQHVIAIDFWSLTDNEDTLEDIKSKFFNSFSIHSKKAETTATSVSIIEPNTKDVSIASKLGHLAGEILFFATAIALLIGLFFLGRYIFRKKRTPGSKTKVVNTLEPRPKEVICSNCETENNSDSKYCKRCGYKL